MARVSRLVVAFAALLVAISGQAHGGVIAYDSNNIVTSWASNTAGETYYFYAGSYNDNSAIIKQFPSGIDAIDNIVNEFVTDLGSTSSILSGNPMYAFDQGWNANTTKRVHNGVFEDNSTAGTWSASSNIETSPTETTRSFAGSTRTLYWASTTAPSNGAVPEPSTAVAMGLLCLAGLAGNRRRRRQS